MVHQYEQHTGDTEWVRSILPEMVTEFLYWQDEHLVTFEKNGKRYSMVRYNCQDMGPRPESYFEDFNLVRNFAEEEAAKNEMYWELKTGAESGWDYSTRWFISNRTNQGKAKRALEEACTHFEFMYCR